MFNCRKPRNPFPDRRAESLRATKAMLGAAFGDLPPSDVLSAMRVYITDNLPDIDPAQLADFGNFASQKSDERMRE